ADGAGAVAPAVGFANDGQYLLVSEASIADLRTRLQPLLLWRNNASSSDSSSSGSQGMASSSSTSAATVAAGGVCISSPSPSSNLLDPEHLIARLRPNLIVSGFRPYDEDTWTAVQIGSGGDASFSGRGAGGPNQSAATAAVAVVVAASPTAGSITPGAAPIACTAATRGGLSSDVSIDVNRGREGGEGEGGQATAAATATSTTTTAAAGGERSGSSSAAPIQLQVLGGCPRCELLQIDPWVGVRRGPELLVAIAQYRR
ncbi:hypothetical protein Agub_g2673, partial [Astrephomene gubernaculifera]